MRAAPRAGLRGWRDAGWHAAPLLAAAVLLLSLFAGACGQSRSTSFELSPVPTPGPGTSVERLTEILVGETATPHAPPTGMPATVQATPTPAPTATALAMPLMEATPEETTAPTPVPSATPVPVPLRSVSSVPPSGRRWPAKVDLVVGERYTHVLQDGSSRMLTLLGYKVVVPRHKIEATVRVSGNGRTDTHMLHVALDGVPVSINGLRVYAYAWKEANDYDFEPVGEQGGFPLAKGKDVGFAVSDAAFTMYPGMERFTYPFEVAFHEGAFLQTWLEPDGWAHSGYDAGAYAGSRVLAITDGYAYFTWYSNQGYVTLKPQEGKYSKPGWVVTHIERGSNLVEEGQAVSKGTPLARIIPNPTPPHFHMGATPNDFGVWILAAEIWNYEHRDDCPAPRHWLALGPYPGAMGANHIHIDETGDLPALLVPRAGALDLGGSKRWRVADNFVNSVVRVGELLSEAPFSGYEDREGLNSVGYLATHVYSPSDHTGDSAVHLKWGLSWGGKVWLNGKSVWSGVETRYESYNLLTESPLLIDKYDLPLPLRQGWNTLIIKTNHGARTGTAWLMSPKIGDAAGKRIPELTFSMRDITLQATAAGGVVNLAWARPDFHSTFVDTYKLDVATDAGFRDLVVSDRDVGDVTSYTLTGLSAGREYFVRVKPFNSSELSGTVYWQHTDVVAARVP